MSDTTLNAFVASGTAAERVAFVPDPPTPVVGPDPGYFFFETDTSAVYAWDGAAWVLVANGGTGDVVGPAASVDGEIALYDLTSGKLLKRATGTGLVRVTSGVYGTPGAVNLTSEVTGDLPLSNLAQASAASRLLGRGSASGAGDYQEITLGSGLTMTSQVLSATGSSSGGIRVVGILINEGGTVLTPGVKGFVRVPYAGTITKVTVLSVDAASTSGSIVVDVWKDVYANYPPTNADSITASAPPTLSSANKSEDATLTGWSTSVTAGDVFGFNVDSATTVTSVLVEIEVTT